MVNRTPQQNELQAKETKAQEPVFFNLLKPGIHLVKADSVTGIAIRGAKIHM